jgi:hypothetical protein
MIRMLVFGLRLLPRTMNARIGKALAESTSWPQERRARRESCSRGPSAQVNVRPSTAQQATVLVHLASLAKLRRDALRDNNLRETVRAPA